MICPDGVANNRVLLRAADVFLVQWRFLRFKFPIIDVDIANRHSILQTQFLYGPCCVIVSCQYLVLKSR